MKKICLFIVLMLVFIPVCFAVEDVKTTTSKALSKQECKGNCNSEEKKDELLNDGKSAILMDYKTGKILYQKNVHERFAPASMTKIMSMILIMEQIEKGKLKWNDKLVTSENAASMGGSQIFLQPNEKMSVKDLFKAVAIGSANDATVVFAESISGTEQKFVNKMNSKAKALGLKDTNFKNAVGLDEANHYSSAYDMSIMARELIKHEKIFEFTTIYEDYLRQNTDNKFWLVNTNKLIKTYPFADGLKTGYTKEAGYCLTATAKKDNLRLIGVIMGAKESNSRNSNMQILLDYGFNSYNMQTIIKKGSKITTKKMIKSNIKDIDIVAKDDLSILVLKGEEKEGLNYEAKLNKINLPLKKGDVVGKLILKNGKKVVSESLLMVNKDVKKVNILLLYTKLLKKLLYVNI